MGADPRTTQGRWGCGRLGSDHLSVSTSPGCSSNAISSEAFVANLS